ncbi:GIY-YIG nuclease family protein [Opitutales bacterium]|nr:GIY-YIG nuclease family protein [Opitutales bacterium]
MQDLEKLWDELNRQPLHRFADWPNRDVPKGQPGVYLIYQGNDLKYVGMASANLYGRLTQHARGRRSGDQFCVYVSDRLVMKNLTDEQIKGISLGTYSLDHQIRDFIRTELSYCYVLVSDDPTARALERYGLQIAKGQGAELLNTL